MKHFTLPLLLTLALALAACSTETTALPSIPTANAASSTPNPASPTSKPESIPSITPTPTDDPSILEALFPNLSGNTDMTRIDQQGAVIFNVTPLNFDAPVDNLKFNILMDTHSIDLIMDLATHAALTTDIGITVQATAWDAPRGGHHVSGTLMFPSMKDGKSILDGATKLALTIVNVDADSRVFEWDLK